MKRFVFLLLIPFLIGCSALVVKPQTPLEVVAYEKGQLIAAYNSVAHLVEVGVITPGDAEGILDDLDDARGYLNSAEKILFGEVMGGNATDNISKAQGILRLVERVLLEKEGRR